MYVSIDILHLSNSLMSSRSHIVDRITVNFLVRSLTCLHRPCGDSCLSYRKGDPSKRIVQRVKKYPIISETSHVIKIILYFVKSHLCDIYLRVPSIPLLETVFVVSLFVKNTYKTDFLYVGWVKRFYVST